LEDPIQGATTARRFQAPAPGLEIMRASLRLGFCESQELIGDAVLTVELVARGRGGSAQFARSTSELDVKENCRNMLLINYVLR
jgi:hypothetical protein